MVMKDAVVMEVAPMPMATEATARAALKMAAATKAEAMEVVVKAAVRHSWKRAA